MTQIGLDRFFNCSSLQPKQKGHPYLQKVQEFHHILLLFHKTETTRNLPVLSIFSLNQENVFHFRIIIPRMHPDCKNMRYTEIKYPTNSPYSNIIMWDFHKRDKTDEVKNDKKLKRKKLTSFDTSKTPSWIFLYMVAAVFMNACKRIGYMKTSI